MPMVKVSYKMKRIIKTLSLAGIFCTADETNELSLLAPKEEMEGCDIAP